MITERFRRVVPCYPGGMRAGAVCLAYLFAAAALLAWAGAKVKITTVSAEYTPPLSFYKEPVWVAAHHFEVDPRTGRTTIVVEYQFPFQTLEAWNNGALGPDNTQTEVPGLTWDAATRAVVYESGGQKTVCAQAPPRSHKLKLKNTKSCRVTWTVRERTPADQGLEGAKVLDVWLETN